MPHQVYPTRYFESCYLAECQRHSIFLKYCCYNFYIVTLKGAENTISMRETQQMSTWLVKIRSVFSCTNIGKREHTRNLLLFSNLTALHWRQVEAWEKDRKQDQKHRVRETVQWLKQLPWAWLAAPSILYDPLDTSRSDSRVQSWK